MADGTKQLVPSPCLAVVADNNVYLTCFLFSGRCAAFSCCHEPSYSGML